VARRSLPQKNSPPKKFPPLLPHSACIHCYDSYHSGMAVTTFRCSDAQMEAFREAAWRAKKSLNAWMLDRCLMVVSVGPEAVLAPERPKSPPVPDAEPEWPDVIGAPSPPEPELPPEQQLQASKKNLEEFLKKLPPLVAAKPLPPPKPKDIWGRTFEDFPEAK